MRFRSSIFWDNWQTSIVYNVKKNTSFGAFIKYILQSGGHIDKETYSPMSASGDCSVVHTQLQISEDTTNRIYPDNYAVLNFRIN